MMNNIHKHLQDKIWMFLSGQSSDIHLLYDEAKYVHHLITKDQTFPYYTELKNYKDASFYLKVKLYIFGSIKRDMHPTGVIAEFIEYKGKQYLINITLP